MPTLYLIPTPIAEETMDHIPLAVVNAIGLLDCFVVEKLRTARRFIRSVIKDYDIDGADFIELDKRNPQQSHMMIKELLTAGRSFGLMSEAGLPCIADPGHDVVNQARASYYKIVPITGPSSIFMALMASGLNGQEFTFHGYLPIKEPALTKKLKAIQDNAIKTGYTQIFIETPYRNQKLYEKMSSTFQHTIRLCIAQDISAPEEYIDTRTIAHWRKQHDLELKKSPCIFLINT